MTGRHERPATPPLFAWNVAAELPKDERDAALPDLTPLQMQLLANRGIHRPDAARSFLAAGWRREGPALLGLERALARLRQAQAQRESVAVFGDYDVDGLTSCALMTLALRAAGIAAEPYLPSRIDDGRGPSESAIRMLAENGHTLLVTTDGGTTNVAEIRLAESLGLEVIITDHHAPQGELARALALVNPQQPGCPSPEKHLAGVGVAIRVAEAFLEEAAPESAVATLESLLDLTAIGTIGDVAPLTAENWRLVRAGLQRLNTSPRVGLRALTARAGLAPGTITERDIGFALAPRLNAAGRMGDPHVALRLLLTDDPSEAEALAEQLQRLNEERQRVTDRLMLEARKQAAPQVKRGAALLVARGEGWPLGVIGLVASRLAEEFARPAVVVSLGETDCRGSLRGPAGFHLAEALGRQAALLRFFGGHAQAAGFTVARADLETLLDHLRAAAQAQLGRAGAEPREPLEPPPADLVEAEADSDGPPVESLAALPSDPDAPRAPLAIDCRMKLSSVTLETYASIRHLAPFGVGFAEPVLLTPNVKIASARRSGPEGRTLRLALRDAASGQQRPARWSRQGELLAVVREFGQRPLEVVYQLEVDDRPGFGREAIMRVLDLRPVE